MKRFYTLTAVIAILIASVGMTLKPLQASKLAQANCTAGTVQGRYGFLAPATVVVGPGTVIAVPEAYLYASPAAYASQGTLAFEGAGQVILTAVADQQMTLVPPIAYAGSYTVTPHCIALATFDNGTAFRFQVVAQGKVAKLRSLTPSFVIVDEAG